MSAPDPWEKWMRWIADHPLTLLYLVVVMTLNLVINVIEVFMT